MRNLPEQHEHMKIKLSVTIITFNEERNIARCIKSVEGIADEIIVVDSFSTDCTKSICQSLGVIFIEHAFEGHIQQKNYALAQTSYNHVLSLDADEELSEELKRSVLKAKQNWSADAYHFNRFNNYCGKWIHHSGWYPDRKIRLFDKSKAMWGGQNPHDRIVLDANSRVKFLSGDILHYSYYNLEQHLRKIDSFSTIFQEEMVRKGKHVPFLALVYKPPFRFLKTYIIDRGFLDGSEGFMIAMLSSYHVFLKYAKVYVYYRNKN